MQVCNGTHCVVDSSLCLGCNNNNNNNNEHFQLTCPLIVRGNLTIDSRANLTIQITNPNRPVIVVTGNADLRNSTLTVVVGEEPTTGESIVLVEANGNVTGTPRITVVGAYVMMMMMRMMLCVCVFFFFVGCCW